jgi:hypothetical protein
MNKYKLLPFFTFMIFLLTILNSNVYPYGTLANTPISNGGDAGTLNVLDVDGDTILNWEGGLTVSSVTCTSVTIYVDTGTAAIWVSTPTVNYKNVAPGTTAYIYYSVRNGGNANDIFYLFITSETTNASNISLWQWRIHRDDPPYGEYNNEPEVTNTGTLQAEVTYYFQAAVLLPVGTVNGSSTTFRVRVKANYGSGTEDNWPNGETGNDDISHYIIVKYEEAKFLLSKSTAVVPGYGRERPGDQYEYVLVIKSTGVVAPVNGTTVLRDRLPTNVDIVEDWSGQYDIVAKRGATERWYDFSSSQYATYDVGSRTVIIKFDEFDPINPGDEIIVRFRVRVK